MKKFWLLLIGSIIFSALSVILLIFTGSTFVGILFTIVSVCLAIICIIGFKFAIKELKEKIAAEAEKGEKRTKNRFILSIVFAVLICIAIVFVVYLGIGYTECIDINYRTKNLMSEPMSEETYEDFIFIDNSLSQKPWYAKIFFGYKEELAKKLDDCADYIDEQSKIYEKKIKELKTVKKLTSITQYNQLQSKINEIKLTGETVYEQNLKQKISNYNKLEKYERKLNNLLDTYKTNCTSCSSNGRTTCTSCNGRGKKLVTWYSEGDWGETSYSSYTCTSCNGSGKKSCGYCGGRGYRYSFN